MPNEKLQVKAEKGDELLELRKSKQQELNGITSEIFPTKLLRTLQWKSKNQISLEHQNCIDNTKQEDDGISCKIVQVCANVIEEIQYKAILAGQEEYLDKGNQSGEFLAESMKAELVESIKN